MAEIGYARAILTGGRRVWGFALLETLVVAGVSLLPLLAGAFREILFPNATVTLGDAFGRAFLSGQLLFYAMGLIATVVWLCNKDRKAFFPWRTIVNLLCLVEIVVCSIIVGFDPTLEKINKDTLSTYSIWLFVVSVVLYILMSVIGEVQVNVGKALAKSDAALGDAVRKSRNIG